MRDRCAQIWTTVKKFVLFSVILFISIALLGTVPDVALAQGIEPLEAADLVFYEGNDCTQDIVFTYDSEKSADDNCQSSGTACHGDNDEARSLFIASYAVPGARVKVFDSPSADTTDDFAVIDILSDVPPVGGTCVGTFEQNALRPGYKINYVPKNGLDGKVSHITVRP